MESNDKGATQNDAARRDEATAVDPVGANIVGANLIGMNSGTGTGGIVAPAASVAAAEAARDGDDQPVNLDVLGRFGNNRGETGDAGVSTSQAELESDELNG